MPLDQATGELAAILAARIDAAARLCVDRKAPLPHRRKQHARTVIDDARSALAAGEAASMRSALRSIDLLALELCDE